MTSVQKASIQVKVEQAIARSQQHLLAIQPLKSDFAKFIYFYYCVIMFK